MKIMSLGHGGAFATSYEGNTNFLINHNDKLMLFDLSHLSLDYLRRNGIDPKDIDAVYISHTHADHMSGLEIFLQMRYWMPKLDENGNRILPKLFCHKDIYYELERSLIFGLSCYDSKIGRNIEVFDYVEYGYESVSFEWEGIQFNFEETTHMPYCVDLGMVNYEKPVYGLSFEVNGKKVLFTADTNQVAKLENYDIVFHDCETGNFKSGVHCHYDDLIQYITEKNPLKTKVYAVHYTNSKLDDNSNIVWFSKQSTIDI
jgi:ribonuclease BN (tRNA processing enzyme)